MAMSNVLLVFRRSTACGTSIKRRSDGGSTMSLKSVDLHCPLLTTFRLGTLISACLFDSKHDHNLLINQLETVWLILGDPQHYLPNMLLGIKILVCLFSLLKLEDFIDDRVDLLGREQAIHIIESTSRKIINIQAKVCSRQCDVLLSDGSCQDPAQLRSFGQNCKDCIEWFSFLRFQIG